MKVWMELHGDSEIMPWFGCTYPFLSVGDDSVDWCRAGDRVSPCSCYSLTLLSVNEEDV